MVKSAKGKAAGKRPALTQEAPVSLAVRVILEVGSDVPSYYINYADVAQSNHEFTLSVAKMPTRLGPQAVRTLQETGELHVETLLQLLIPPTLLPSLLKALTVQKDLYEKAHGPIRDASEQPAPLTMGTLQ